MNESFFVLARTNYYLNEELYFRQIFKRGSDRELKVEEKFKRNTHGCQKYRYSITKTQSQLVEILNTNFV